MGYFIHINLSLSLVLLVENPYFVLLNSKEGREFAPRGMVAPSCAGQPGINAKHDHMESIKKAKAANWPELEGVKVIIIPPNRLDPRDWENILRLIQSQNIPPNSKVGVPVISQFGPFGQGGFRS